MLSFSFIDALFVILNLFVLYLLMRKFLFGPVNRIIDARQAEIGKNLKDAQAKREEAERLHDEYDVKLAVAGQQAQELMQNARYRSEREYQATMEKAQAESQALITDTQTQLAREREQMIAGVRREVATLAILAAAKVSAGGVSADTDTALVDAFLAEEAGDVHE